MSKRIVIVGASSGLGKEIALIFLEKGWKVGIASRNIEALKEIEKLYPQSAVSQQIDINNEDAIINLENLTKNTARWRYYAVSMNLLKLKCRKPDLEQLLRCRLIFPDPVISLVQFRKIHALHTCTQKAHRIICRDHRFQIDWKLDLKIGIR